MKSLFGTLILALLIAGCSRTHQRQRTVTAADVQIQEQSNAQSASNAPAAADPPRPEDHPDVTAQDQSETDRDRNITQLVRQAVIADDSLSMTAKNCTIVTREGVVMLRGRVPTDAERSSVERAARRVDGVERVDNALQVRP